MGVGHLHAAILGFEFVERRRAQAMSPAHLSCRHPSFLFFNHPNYLGFGKSTLLHLFAPSKVEQTLHETQGSFRGQVTSHNRRRHK